VDGRTSDLGYEELSAQHREGSMSAPAMELSEKSAIVASLKCGNGVSCYGELLACYPTHDRWYYVDYIFSAETIDKLNLTTSQRNLIKEEEELNELFETPEEAADFYLRVRGPAPLIEHTTKKRTLKEKIKKTEKDIYFE
jgi:hypothetical protein